MSANRTTKIILLILALIVLASGISFAVVRQSTVSNSANNLEGAESLPADSAPQTSRLLPGASNALQDDAKNWRTYTDAQYGFTFRYPTRWGAVISKDGNRQMEGDILCGYTGGTRKSGYCVACIFDKEITFSEAPQPRGVWIRVLKVSDSTRPLSLCQATNDLFYPSTEWERFEKSGEKNFFTSDSGYKIYSPGYYYSDFDNQARRSYYTLTRNVWLEANFDYHAPEGSAEMLEVKKNFACENPGDLNCGLVGLLNSDKSTQIKIEFDAFRDLVSSFKILP